MNPGARPRRLATYPCVHLTWVVFAFSGGAALGYQAIWARQLASGLGHELPAVLAVVTAVMAGMGAGAWALDRPVSASSRPAHWYVLLEVVIGVWGGLTALLLPWLNHAAANWLGLDPSPWRQAAVVFLIPALALGPATMAMGATFPAMERFVSRALGRGRVVGAVYAANTAGAALGVLLAAWWLVPTLGLRTAAFALAGTNVACAALVWILSRQLPCPAVPEPADAAEAAAQTHHPAPPLSRRERARWQLWVAMTGFLGIGFEVLGIRVLSQVLENTVYTYASVLAVFLVGTAAGAAWQQRRAAAGHAAPQQLGGNLLALGVACGAGMAALQTAPVLLATAGQLAGGSAPGQALAEACVAAVVFLPPTFFMGRVFSLLAQALRTATGGVGLAAGWNTLGGALAPGILGAGALPWLGARTSLALVTLGYLGLSLLPRPQPTARRFWQAACATAAVLTITSLLDLRFLEVPDGGRVCVYREGPMGTVAVVEAPDGSRVLRVDNRFQMGGTAALDPQSRQAHLPLLLHGAAQRALFLGTGTGITLGAATLHPHLTLEGVELVPEVVEAMDAFAPANRMPLQPPQVRLHVADARRFAAVSPATYDVIVADLFHPARDGAGFLYTREHFGAIRSRLAPAGLFCQWLPLHQMGDRTLASVTRTFLEVFPDAQLWLLRLNVDTPVVGLVGRTTGRIAAEPRPAPAPGPLADELQRLALGDALRLHGHVLAHASVLRTFAEHAPLNTDDRPVVVFLAPRETPAPLRRLDRWLGIPGLAAAAVATAPANPQLAELTQYLPARDAYLRGLVAEGEGRHTAATDAFLESARLCPHFTPGYAQCLTRAALLAQTDRNAARTLLRRLVAAQPGRSVAEEMLRRLE